MDWILLDISIEMLQLSRSGAPRVCGEVTRLPFRNNAISGIAMISVLQYLEMDAAFTEISRVLADGAVSVIGTIVVADEDTDSWRDHAFQNIAQPYLGRFRHKSAVIAAAEGAGLALIDERDLKFRRDFTKLNADKQGTAESRTLSAGVQVWRSAPRQIRDIYNIDGSGFDQTYALLAFRKGAPEHGRDRLHLAEDL